MNQNSDVIKDIKRLNQTDTLERLRRAIPLTEMVTVYWSDRSSTHSHGIYCALFPSSQIQDGLARTTWDLSHGHGYPGACIFHKNGKNITEYYRFGDNSGIEPLIIDRGFYGMRPDYQEINEEFRLFHHLYSRLWPFFSFVSY